MTINHQEIDWEQRINDYHARSTTGKAWCEEHGIKQHQLFYQMKKLKQSTTQVSKKPEWLPLTVSSNGTLSPLIKIQIDNTSIEIYREISKEMLSDVFAIIKEQC